MSYRQLSLEAIVGIELVPQAIVARPISYFEKSLGISFVKDRDDLDEFEGAALLINDKLHLALKHYPGYPADTTTIYLPYEINDLAQITEIIRLVADELHISSAWIGFPLAWQRSDDPVSQM